MAISPDEVRKVGGFMSSLVTGVADLGFAALPLVALYQKAKKENIPFAELIVQDPQALSAITDALLRQAKKLPPSVLATLEEVIKKAKET